MRILFVSLFLLASCGSADPENCHVTDNGDGTYTLVCPNSEVVISDGQDGVDGINGQNGTDGVDGQNGSDLENLFVGNGTLHGSLEVHNDIDLFVLSHYSSVTGNVRTYVETDINLPSMQHIDGEFKITMTSNINMPNLNHVGSLAVGCNALNLDNLGTTTLTVDGDVILVGNTQMTDCYLTDWVNTHVNQTAGAVLIMNNQPCP